MANSPPNFADQTIWTGDNLEIMRGMNSETVDLIYLDPPFNSKTDYAAPVGSKAAGAAFKDTWTLSEIDGEWCDLLENNHPGLWHLLTSVAKIHSKSMMSYLIYMAPRIMEMRRLLKPTGNLFLHCDRHANCLLRALLDALFGNANFRAEIVWQRASGRAKGSQHASKKLGVDTDTIFHYSRTGGYTWHPPTVPLSMEELDVKFPLADNRGRYNTDTPMFRSPSQGERPNLCYTYNSPHGPVSNPHPSGWRVSEERLAEMDKRGEIVWREGKRPLRKSYLEDYKGKPLGTLWTDISNVSGSSREYTGYKTQKPVALLERIIKAASNPGDMVLDPFCGCATTCIAAEKLGEVDNSKRRQWVGIDISSKATRLVKLGISGVSPLLTKDIFPRKDIPKRTDMGKFASPKTSKNKKLLYGEQEGKCMGCKELLDMRQLDFDHIVPLSKGGPDHVDNLQLLCTSCNTTKSNRPMEYLMLRLKQAGII